MELWAFLENSDFQRRTEHGLYRQDEVRLIRHDEFIEHDYQLLVDLGCVGVRDAARWYITHPAPGVFDWSWLDCVVEASTRAGLKLYIDLWHYGCPDWFDLMGEDAPHHFAEFARAVARRYPSIEYYCVSNEPTLLVEFGGRTGRWRPFLRGRKNALALRRQICRLIIAGSEAILAEKPDAVLIVPEPWHATYGRREDTQAAVLDTVMGRHEPELGGRSELVTIVGLNHYRDSTLPPFHKLIVSARDHWPDKPLWLTETSGPPRGWQQTEWFWWMMSEILLAQYAGVELPVFTWAPTISMYDWIDEKRQLRNGIWNIAPDGSRVPNGLMIEAVELARSYGYLR